MPSIVDSHRRQLLSTGAALALGGNAFAALATPSAAARLTEATSGHPWMLPLQGVRDTGGQPSAELRSDALALTGRWPDGLRGRFYRNGPALFERAGQRYGHWFDGDGMVQQFSVTGAAGAARVAHQGRLVQTSKLRQEQRAGRFLYSAFGTGIAPSSDAPVSGPDSFNTANTNALEHAGRVLALWEGGSAHALSPHDLSTQGPVTWGEGLAQVPFSAHPKVDSQGNLWNIGTSGRRLIVWHIDAQGKLGRVQLGELPLAHAMVHDMAITERYIVVPIPPLQLLFDKLMQGGTPAEAMPYDARQPMRVLVLDKNDIQRRRLFELPARMVFHVGNAHETAQGDIVLSMVTSPTHGFLTRGATAMMRGEVASDVEPSQTTLLRLNMANGQAETQRFDDQVEFPRVNQRLTGQATRWLLSCASWLPQRPETFFHGIQLRDLTSGQLQRYDYGAGQVAEEHVLVPKPGRQGELDAWILGTRFDSAAKVTRLSVFEAAHLADGPIAQASLPYWLPYGFHGNFTPA